MCPHSVWFGNFSAFGYGGEVPERDSICLGLFVSVGRYFLVAFLILKEGQEIL